MSLAGSTRSPRIQFVSRVVLIPGTHGGGEYAMDLLRYLREAGCEIEYDLLRPVRGEGALCYVIPREVVKLASMSAVNARRIGRVMIDTRPDWLLLALRLFYLSVLPESLRRVCRTVRAGWRRLRRRGMNDSRLDSAAWDALPNPGEIRFVRQRFEKYAPDVVIADYAWLGPVLDMLPTSSPILKVILTKDILHHRVADFTRLGLYSGHLDWTRESESAALRTAHVLLAIQEQDARVLREMAPDCEVLCLPMAASPRRATTRQIPGRCLFVGSYAPHNVTGLLSFLETVWPQVLKVVPHATLHVCGAVCRAINHGIRNVRLLGIVKNLKAEYGMAEVCLVPLQVGSGLKIKLIEAISFGRACVSTSQGLQGMPELKDKAVLVADTPAEFAAAVRTLLTDSTRRAQMEEYAFQFASTRLSPHVAYQPFVDRIHAHMLKARGRAPYPLVHAGEMAEQRHP